MHDVVTAGVLLRYKSYWVFQTGLNRAGDALGVVRLGGHVEAGEAAVSCACREAQEEGNTEVSVVGADRTWSYVADGDTFQLTPSDEEVAQPAPLLVTTMAPDPGLSVTYVGTTRDRPAPGAETQALIFLTEEEVAQMTTEALSLGAFLDRGSPPRSDTSAPGSNPSAARTASSAR